MPGEGAMGGITASDIKSRINPMLPPSPRPPQISFTSDHEHPHYSILISMKSKQNARIFSGWHYHPFFGVVKTRRMWGKDLQKVRFFLRLRTFQGSFQRKSRHILLLSLRCLLPLSRRCQTLTLSHSLRPTRTPPTLPANTIFPL